MKIHLRSKSIVLSILKQNVSFTLSHYFFVRQSDCTNRFVPLCFQIRCAKAPFKSERELPLHTVVDSHVMYQCLEERLSQIFEEGEEER